MLFSYIMICIITGIAGGILYLFYNFFRYRLIQSGKLSLKRDSQINKYYIISLLVVSAGLTYFAYYPTDRFYYDEFTSATLRKIPSSAEIIKKRSSYPDVHGKYCSSSLVQISKEDYTKLYNELSQDLQFKKGGEILNAEEFDQVLNKDQRNNISYFVRIENPKTYRPYSYIGFLNDRETLIIDRCSD